jgi:hypothetical protein
MVGRSDRIDGWWSRRCHRTITRNASLGHREEFPFSARAKWRFFEKQRRQRTILLLTAAVVVIDGLRGLDLLTSPEILNTHELRSPCFLSLQASVYEYVAGNSTVIFRVQPRATPLFAVHCHPVRTPFLPVRAQPVLYPLRSF